MNKTFIMGTLLLTTAAFLGECLEFLINMLLARELGETGLGMYMSILPTIVFLIVIASMELPVSVSKAVAERETKYHLSLLSHTLRFTVAFTLACLAAAFLVFPLIPVFASYHTSLPYLLLILIPVISLSSVARGYFMGVQRMGKIALANFLRRAIQLVLLIAVFRWFHFEEELAILISLATLIATEVVVFVYLILCYQKEIRQMKKETTASPLPKRSVLQTLLNVSLPTTGLRIFHAASFAAKPFLIKVALMNAGVMEQEATIQYGKLAGVAFTIGFFPAFIAHSLLIILIPTVAESYAKKDILSLHSLLQKILFFTLVYAAPAAAIFYFFSGELTSLFFEDSPAVVYLQLLVPYFFFHFFAIPMQAFLIGLGLVRDAFLHSVWSTTLSFVLMYMLGSMPVFQMDGIIIGMNTGVVVLTLLHYTAIRRQMEQPIRFRVYEMYEKKLH
ncbi:polysaccharide biosynthesis protein [Alteribacillus iranensis]|uniref:Membrane protein involved in the export of O-antigen and teichoic acid n=1 Tax=Alteribacillus iranensis TaxID=930128 RepID=A0A1I2CVR6_9BACI|nr:polysaccharide biosynthesis protein [Alteribacillus iranensis]SFE71800.1 Membrane protein involved in the export of O-antigen and teichoic acid [Alteribacillus iranensis]